MSDKKDSGTIDNKDMLDSLIYSLYGIEPRPITLPKGLSIDELKIPSPWKRFEHLTISTPNGSMYPEVRHVCKYDKSYTGLIETFKYCSCGKKEPRG